MRLFISVNADQRLKKSLETLMKELAKIAKGRFVPLENLHITLAFLGETSYEKEIKAAVCALDGKAFMIKLSGIGRFKNSKGDTLFAGVEKNENLFLLRENLYKNLISAKIPLDKRKFYPHITLVRGVFTEKPFELDNLSKSFASDMEINRISLMKSELTREGPVYTEIYSKSLC